MDKLIEDLSSEEDKNGAVNPEPKKKHPKCYFDTTKYRTGRTERVTGTKWIGGHEWGGHSATPSCKKAQATKSKKNAAHEFDS